MDAAAALDYWLGRTDHERRPMRYQAFDLSGVRELLARLGDPDSAYPIVHVAGTKGKGSTAAMTAAIFRRAGYRVGLFTSPHLVEMTERIQIDGEPIAPDELAERLREIAACVSEKAGDAEPTVFELATVLGFLQFARRKVDVAVVEVGLGGRLDATNVCRPRVSLITSISFDHMAQLGNTLAAIAREKAGILKPGVPAVSGATHPEASAMIRAVAETTGSPLTELGDGLTIRARPGRVADDGKVTPTEVEIADVGWHGGPYRLALIGEHQAANAAVAVAGVRRSGLAVSDAAIADGLATVRWPARLEVFPGRPMTLLDCAHNPASAAALARALDTAFPPARRVLVFAAARDKDVPGILRELLPRFDEVIYTRFANNPRSAPAERLTEWHADIAPRTPARFVEPASAALAAARADASAGLICVAGSLYLAGELRPVLTASTNATPPIS